MAPLDVIVVRGAFGAPFDKFIDMLASRPLDAVIDVGRHRQTEQGDFFFTASIPEQVKNKVIRSFRSNQMNAIALVGVIHRKWMDEFLKYIQENSHSEREIRVHYVVLEGSVKPKNVPKSVYENTKDKLDIRL
jgi:hypothetical protein